MNYVDQIIWNESWKVRIWKFYLQFAYHYDSSALMFVQLVWQFVTEQGQGGYRELRQWTLYEFLWITVSNIALFVTVHLSLIWLSSHVTLYKWNLSKLFIILPFLVICKISIISSIGTKECLLSLRCCANLEFPLPYLKF